ncbi:MAG: bacterial Ig-like domain-containing protein [Clostridia bacterium]|nr:bacterial Ig-like domain-containing protein [Clostridia bacterium]
MTKSINKIKYFVLVALFAIASVFAIGCGENKIKGISVDVESYKDTVYQYQDYDLSTIKLVVDMKKGEDKIVGYAEVSIYEGDEKITELDTSVPGEKELKIKYEGFETTIKINIIELELTEITANTANCNLNVYQGGVIDFSNLVVKAKFNDLSEKVISVSDPNLSITYSTDIVGEKDCVVAYTYSETTKSTSFKINVKEVNVQSISVAQDALSGFKFYQYQGVEGLDFSAIKVNILNNDSSTDEVAFNDVNVAYEFDLSTAGDKSLTITYFEKTATVPYTVIALDSVDFKYNGSDNAIEIWENEELDSSKIAVDAIYADEHKISLTQGQNGYSINAINKEIFTEQDLTVTYNGKSDTIKVTVKEVVLLSIEITEYPNEIYEDETLNASNVKVVAKYSNDAEVELAYADVQFNSLDMTTYDTQTLTATYEGKTDSVQIIVKEREENRAQEKSYTIDSFEDPAFVNVYYGITRGDERKYDNVESQADLLDKANPKKMGFESLNDSSFKPLYVIGDDNPFRYEPIIMSMVDYELEPITEYKTLTEIYIWRDDAYVKLDRYSLNDENKISYYVAIDDEAHTYDFTENAIGHQFKIVVEPYLYDPELDADIDGGSVFEFVVKNGWNAYDVEDLKLFDNIDLVEADGGMGDEDDLVKGKWGKTEEEKALSNSIGGIILHNDIDIKLSDLPDYYKDVINDSKYQGTYTRNHNGPDGWIFAREISEGTVFNFEGNYFKISASSIPRIVRESFEEGETGYPPEGTPVVTNLVLFGFKGVTKDAYGNVITYAEDKVPTFNINNVEFIGNSQESASDKNWGGISTFKAGGAHINIDNCLFTRWYMAMMYETEHEFDHVNKTEFNVTNTNAYDASNTLMYLWGAENVYLENTKLIGSAGPVMICDHVDYDENTDPTNGGTNEGPDVHPEYDGYRTNVKTKDCYFESWLSGEEPWFVSFGVTADFINPIKSLNYLMPADGKYIDANQRMNIIGLYKIGDIPDLAGGEAMDIRGSFTDISEGDAGLKHSMALDFTLLHAMMPTISLPGGITLKNVYDNGAPIITTSNGYMAFYNGSSLSAMDPDVSINDSDYLFMYHGGTGMAFVLGLVQDGV